MIKKALQSSALALAVLLLGQIAFAQSGEIVASLDRLEGRAQVLVAETNRRITGRNGLLLKVGDTVITREKSRVTIKFRDGSEVRLFPKSEFVIQASKESRSKRRAFTYRLFLKLGSIWGSSCRRGGWPRSACPRRQSALREPPCVRYSGMAKAAWPLRKDAWKSPMTAARSSSCPASV